MDEQHQQLDLDQVRRDVAARANEIAGQAVDFARANPHAAVGIAFALGWVLGNGIPPRAVTAAARMGWRAMIGGALAGGGMMNVLNSVVGKVAEAASAGGASAGGEPRQAAVRSNGPRGASSSAGAGSARNGTRASSSASTKE